MKTTIVFVKEVEMNIAMESMEFIKFRFQDSFPGFKQNQEGDFEECETNEIMMFKSKALAMIFSSIPELALAYNRTESFACIAAAMQGATCELNREKVRDENADHDRFNTEITDITVSDKIRKLLDKEIERAFE